MPDAAEVCKRKGFYYCAATFGLKTVIAIASQINSPNAHQSTALLWPLDWIISGAKYSGVPHSVHVRSFNFLANPKSVIFRCPSLSSSRFSGFRSRYTIFSACKYSRARTISQA